MESIINEVNERLKLYYKVTNDEVISVWLSRNNSLQAYTKIGNLESETEYYLNLKSDKDLYDNDDMSSTINLNRNQNEFSQEYRNNENKSPDFNNTTNNDNNTNYKNGVSMKDINSCNFINNINTKKKNDNSSNFKNPTSEYLHNINDNEPKSLVNPNKKKDSNSNITVKLNQLANITSYLTSKPKHILNKIVINPLVIPLRKQNSSNSLLLPNLMSNNLVDLTTNKNSHLTLTKKFFTEKDYNLLETVQYKTINEVFQKKNLQFEINELKLNLNKAKINEYSNTNLINLLIFLFANKINIIKNHLIKFYKGASVTQINNNLVSVNDNGDVIFDKNKEINDKSGIMSNSVLNEKEENAFFIMNKYYNLEEELKLGNSNNSGVASSNLTNSNNNTVNTNKVNSNVNVFHENEVYGFQLFMEGVPTLVLVNNQIPVFCEKKKQRKGSYFDILNNNSNNNKNANNNNNNNSAHHSFNLNNNNINNNNNYHRNSSSIRKRSLINNTVNANINNVYNQKANAINNINTEPPFSDIISVINSYSPAFINVSEQSFWIMLLEKAIASIKGNYLNSVRMLASELILLLTPFPLNSIIHSTTSSDSLFRFIKKNNTDNSIIFVEMNSLLLESYDILYLTSFFVTSLSIINGQKYVELCLPEVISDEVFNNIQQELLSYNQILGNSNEDDNNVSSNIFLNNNTTFNNNNTGIGNTLVGASKNTTNISNIKKVNSTDTRIMNSFTSQLFHNNTNTQNNTIYNVVNNLNNNKRNNSIFTNQSNLYNEAIKSEIISQKNSNRTIIIHFNVYRTLFYKTYLLKPYNNYYYSYKSFKLNNKNAENYLMISLKVNCSIKNNNKKNVSKNDSKNTVNSLNNLKAQVFSNSNLSNSESLHNKKGFNNKANSDIFTTQFNEDMNNNYNKNDFDKKKRVHAILNFGLKHLCYSSNNTSNNSNNLYQNDTHNNNTSKMDKQSNYQKILFERKKLKEEYYTRIIILKKKSSSSDKRKKSEQKNNEFEIKNYDQLDYNDYKISALFYGSITKYTLEANLEQYTEYLIILKSINSDFISQISETNNFNTYKNLTISTNHKAMELDKKLSRKYSYYASMKNSNNNASNSRFTIKEDDVSKTSTIALTCYSAEIVTISSLKLNKANNNNHNNNYNYDPNSNNNYSSLHKISNIEEQISNSNKIITQFINSLLFSLSTKNFINKKDSETQYIEIFSLLKEQPKLGYSYYKVKNNSTTNYLHLMLKISLSGLKLISHQLTSSNFKQKMGVENNEENDSLINQSRGDASESDSSSSIDSEYSKNLISGELTILVPPSKEENFVFEWFKRPEDVVINIKPRFDFKNFSPIVKLNKDLMINNNNGNDKLQDTTSEFAEISNSNININNNEISDDKNTTKKKFPYEKNFIAKKVFYFEIVFQEGIILVLINESMKRKIEIEVEFIELSNLVIERTFHSLFNPGENENENFYNDLNNSNNVSMNINNNYSNNNLHNPLNNKDSSKLGNSHSYNINNVNNIKNIMDSSYTNNQGFVNPSSTNYVGVSDVSNNRFNANNNSYSNFKLIRNYSNSKKIKILVNPCSRNYIFLRKENYGKVYFNANFRLIKENKIDDALSQ